VSVGPRSDPESDSDTHREFMRLADVALLGSYRTAAYVLGDRSEAEDAVQEALVLAWRAWPNLRDVTRFEAWFDRILVNVCYERLRGRRRAPIETLSLDAPLPDKDSFASAIARDAIARALHALTPEQRIVVVLRYGRDLSIEEIAERVCIPSGTVRSRLHYALRALRSELDDEAAPSLEVQQ
jgi:RNA polymerase sigma-70 factor, ECF subfamily